MRMPSNAQRKLLAKAAESYQASITLASSFLTERGLWAPAREWGLGVVESPEPGHEWFKGRLAIPYMNRSGVVGFKFRCLEAHHCKEFSHEKYMALVGQPVWLYNVIACDSPADVIHVTEGELDTIALSSVFVGEPVVGCPGVGQWQPHWGSHFKGFDRVLLWPDGDEAGRNMGNAWRKKVPNAEVARLPNGHDVNSLLLAEGPEIFRKLAGVEE